ncbi:hypothetical protein D3C71_506680 [compost metagenome]
MANLALSVAPGYYLEAQNAGWVLGADVDFVSFNQNGPAPAVSKYIAYDTLVPPNPFIAVTQDGNGNVVYDGGFPKFYNVVAPPAGIDSLFSMEYKGTKNGAPDATNNYYYDAFTDLPVTIAAGDKLVYDMLQNSVDARVGIDAITAASPVTDGAHYSIRDWGGAGPGVIKDQNNLAAHPATDLGTRAVGQWYHREFDLTPAAGHTFIKWSLAYEGELPGVFYTRFKEVYVLDSAGKVKATLFKDSIKLPNSTSTEAGASGYTGTAKYIYDPRSALSPSFKYLFNAIRWCANPAKAKKILVLGDTLSDASYPVKGTKANAFETSLRRIASACGFAIDIKDLSDYGGVKLNCNLAELNQYALVMMFSTLYDPNNTEMITPSAVADLVTFRQQGGGLIFITDHGAQPITSAAQVTTAAGTGFYATANRVTVNFGAWFSGVYDRTPVNVGFIRANYGDHPLYSGMTNAEDIAAGGSESAVVLPTFQKWTAANIPNLSIANNGVNTVKAIAVLKNGEIELYSWVYVIATGQLLKFTNKDGVEINSLPATFGSSVDFAVEVIGAGLGTIEGEVTLNSKRVANLSYSEALGSVESWFLGASSFISVKKGDVFEAKITSPFQFARQLPVTRYQPNITGKRYVAEVVKAMRADGFGIFPHGSVVKEAIARMNLDYSHLQYFPKGDYARDIAKLREYFTSVLELPEQAAFIYGTTAAAAEAMTRLVPPSQATVFNTWDRFANDLYFPGGVGATGEAAAWVWDEAKQAAVMPLNTGGWVGFTSLEAVDSYEVDVVIKSDSADDDTNGIVLAFNRSGSYNNRLYVSVNMGGHPAQPSSLLIGAMQNGVTSTLVTNPNLPAYSNPNFPTDGGWRGRSIRVKASRTGDNFKVVTSQWNSLLLDPATTMNYTIPPTGNPAQFRGKKPWGFINISQPASYFNLRSFKGGLLYDIVVDVQTNKVWRFSDGVWSVLAGMKAQDVFGSPRTLTNSETGLSYKLNANGTITAL